MIWIAVALGSIALVVVQVLWMAISSRKWPTVEGQVIVTDELKTHKGTVYRFAYEYFVNGKRFLSGTIAFFSSEELELKVIQAHKVGSKVLVYFNPKRPEVGILVPGALLRLWTLLSSIAIVCAGGAGYLLWQRGFS